MFRKVFPNLFQNAHAVTQAEWVHACDENSLMGLLASS
jgi:hypothetical protein